MFAPTGFWKEKLLQNLPPLLIFLGVTLAVAVPRIGIPYGWDDGTGFRVVQSTIPITTSVYDTLSQQAYAVWYDHGNPASAYRPLDSLIIIAEVFFFGTNTLIPDFIQAASLAATAVLIYLLGTKLTGNKIIGLGGAFFFSFSIPALGFTWILLQKQIQVSLVIVLGLLGYVQYSKTGNRKWLYILWVSCLVGPLLRELTVILPLTIFFEMLIERRKNPLLLISIPLLTIYGFIPSFLPNLILYGRVVVLSTLTRGYAATQIGSAGLMLSGLHYEMPYVLLLFLPYVVTILAVLSIVLSISHTKRIPKKASLLLAVGFLLLSAVTLAVFPIVVPGYTPNEINIWMFLPTVFVMIIVILSFPANRLLSIWFLVSFLPFYKIYTEDVHLAPASIPWIIMILVHVSGLPTLNRSVSKFGPLIVRNQTRTLQLIRVILISIIALGVAQQSSNLYATYSTFGGMTSEVETMSSLLISNSPQGGLAIVNFPQGGLISLYTGGLIENKLALSDSGWPLSNEVLPNESIYSTIYQSMINTSVFFVTETSPYFPPTYGGLFDGLQRNVADLKLQIQYPLIDPLEGILPRGYTQFPGPADLGGTVLQLSGTAWHREYVASYTISKFSPCQGAACLKILNYAGCYNIFSLNNSYFYAISSKQGFNPQNSAKGGFYPAIQGDSIKRVEQKLNEALNSSAHREVSDDGQATFYSAQGIDYGNLSVPKLNDDSLVVKTGMNSLSINLTSGGSYGGIRIAKSYQTPQNWCSYGKLGFWVYGTNTGDKIVFNIFDGVHNGSWSIADNFTGWIHFGIPLKNLTWGKGSPIDLTNVSLFYWDFHTTGIHRIDGVELES